ncbi:MAG TPA: hypothetical protein VL051_10360 [Burkholderiaceae bacterium]|nr:hypothetical protein [Burkholderiaceae bacterium]
MQRVLILLSAIGTLLILGWLLKYRAYGIDFTDESFYLVWISNPFIYDFSRTQFGFVYHPLYRLLGGDIATLRQANFLITFGLAWGLTYTFLASLAPGFKESRVTLHTVAAGLATSAFMLFASWLPTPSYNSLALQALLITGTGLLLAEKTVTRKSILGWITIGAGGWLAFMAKPSTALALAVGILICLVLSRKFSVRLFLLAAASFAIPLLASAMLIDGTPWDFVKRLQRGMEFGQLLTDKLNQILRIDEFQLDKRTKSAALLVFTMLLIAIWSMWAKNRKWLFIGLSISIAFFALTALLTIGQIYWAAGFGKFQGLLIFGVVFAAALAGPTFGWPQGLKSITASQWAIAGLFLVMPHIYAFGTGNNYWSQGNSAAIFWLLAGLTLLGPLVRERASWLLALPLVLATQAVTAILLQTGFEQPYRQPQPLRLNDTIQEIGPQKSVLLLSAGYAAYLNSATTTARDAGFKPATSVIDLSGQSPGILFALGAKSIGQPWTLGGYPGSLLFLKAGLSRFSCEEIAAAWVLFEPDGPDSISAELMPSLGAEFPEGYKRVGTWHTAKGAGGYAASRIQELYKPIKSQETLMACEMLRSKITR